MYGMKFIERRTKSEHISQHIYTFKNGTNCEQCSFSMNIIHSIEISTEFLFRIVSSDQLTVEVIKVRVMMKKKMLKFAQL